MFATSGDVLNMALAVGVVVLVIFLSILIFYLILVVRDASKVLGVAASIVDMAEKAVSHPLRAAESIFEKTVPYFEAVIDNLLKKKK